MSNLINHSAVKGYILRKLEHMRPYLGFNRVSKSAIETYEARLRAMIIEDIKCHPSLGKTFKLD